MANARATISGALLLAAALAACGQDASQPAASKPPSASGAVIGDLSIADARVRPPMGGQSIAAAYLTVENAGAADRLIAARSAAAEMIELHTNEKQGDVMTMRRVEAVDIPAGGSVELAPGGLHLMLFGVDADALAAGIVDVTLTFETAGEITVAAHVGEHGGRGH